MYVNMYIHKEWDVHILTLQESYTSNEVQGSAYRGVMIGIWFHKTVTQVTKS
jgi:hypothetical protein